MAVPMPHLPGSVGRNGREGAGPCGRQAGGTLLALPKGVGVGRGSRACSAAFGAAPWRCSLYLQGCTEPHTERKSQASPLAEGSSRAPGPGGTLKAIPAPTSHENRGVRRWEMRWQRVHAHCCSRNSLGEVNPSLAVPSFLFYLRLSSNSVGDNGSIALAEALRVNHSLQSLE